MLTKEESLLQIKGTEMELLNEIWELLQHPVVMLIWIHFIADFVMQSDTMAKNKSSSNGWLSLHILAYMVPFIGFMGFQFAIINGALHWITDYVTSRKTSQLWKDGKVHWFFVVVGFDQAIHMTTLFVTYGLLIGF